jgi:DNA-binding CsgD family transcriptional regulator
MEDRLGASVGGAVIPTKVAVPGETARKFSDLEKRVLQLMSEGLTKKEIALTIHVSVHTVNFHLRRVYEKLNVKTNTGAVARAIRENII